VDLAPIGLAAVAGYLVGSISFARLAGRFVAPGVDITATTIAVPQTGERFEIRGAPASSLTGRASWQWRLAVVLLDMAKAAIPTILFRVAYPDSPAYAAAFAFAVIGHIWPIYHGFFGGFGISSIIGGVAVVDPIALVVTIPVGVVVGKVFLDNLSMVNGFAILLPLYFVVIAQNAAMAVASIAVLAAYWIAKRSRLVVVRSQPDGDQP
jgi:glycerol-3-phosphate acyltransferase PlsY